MKYSFIIPALNEENYIAKCIKSINKQVDDSCEIVVVDNGSKDKTSIVAKSLGAKVAKEEKRGISHARNKGAKVAKGEYLCFVDADGVLGEDWFYHVKKFVDGKTPDVLDGLVLYSHKNFIKRILYNIYTFFAYTGLVLSQVIISRHFVTGNNMVIKKSLFDSIGGFEPVVSEQVSFSKELWRKDIKTAVNLKMIIYYSSRGFESSGYIRTVYYWIKSALVKTSQNNYSYKTR